MGVPIATNPDHHFTWHDPAWSPLIYAKASPSRAPNLDHRFTQHDPAQSPLIHAKTSPDGTPNPDHSFTWHDPVQSPLIHAKASPDGGPNPDHCFTWQDPAQSPLIHTKASPDGGPAARAHRDATGARVADHSFANTTTLGPNASGLRWGSSPEGARPRGRGRGSGWGPGLGDGSSRGCHGLVASCWRRWLGNCTVQCIIIIAIKVSSKGTEWIWGCTSGGVYVPCIYWLASWQLPYCCLFGVFRTLINSFDFVYCLQKVGA